MKGDIADKLTLWADDDLDTMRRDLLAAAAEITRLRAEKAELVNALGDAIDSVEAWAAYASDYFKEKHDLNGEIASLRAALSRARGTG